MAGSLVGNAQRIIITPPVGVDLCGFGGREGPSQGVHDDLRACALYLSNGTEELMIITADLIGLHHEEVAEIRAGIHSSAGLSPESVMISCSHTHSGPATRCLNYLGGHDEEYLAELKRRLVGPAGFAKAGARPVQIGVTRAPVSVGINRREWRDGHIILGENPDGPLTPDADILYVDDADGNPVARLWCHAAHPVTLGGDNLLISGDWPGYAQREVERCYGGDCVAMFMQGCCGNINSHPRGSFTVAEKQGQTMAAAVVQADAVTPRVSEAVLRATSKPVGLPLSDPPSLEEAEEAARQLTAEADANRDNENIGLRALHAGVAQWADEILELARNGPQQREVPFEVQALRIGDMGIVGLPGEVFVEYAANIREAGALPVMATAAYTNGNIGYVPTADAYAEGGYEIENAIRYYGTTMQKPESEALILFAAGQAIAQLVR